MARFHAIKGGLDEILIPQGMPPQQWRSEDAAYKQLDIEIDPELGALWSYMRPQGVPCFNPQLLEEIAALERHIEASRGEIWHQGQPVRLRYYVSASRIPGVYNYGGDLALFARLAEARDRGVLMHYATLCVDNLYRRVQSFGQPITTIGVVQGDALGGGFECALGMNVLIAERSSKLGFPEILFNMFPGMGAYSFLARRVSMRVAEDMMYSGATYSGAELAQMGVVDVLAEDGEGEEAARRFMKERARRYNGFNAILQARREISPISREELMRITTIWVDAVLRLESKDLRIMQRLVRAQQARHEETAGATQPVAAPAPAEVQAYVVPAVHAAADAAQPAPAQASGAQRDPRSCRGSPNTRRGISSGSRRPSRHVAGGMRSADRLRSAPV